MSQTLIRRVKFFISICCECSLLNELYKTVGYGLTSQVLISNRTCAFSVITTLRTRAVESESEGIFRWSLSREKMYRL
jgi:hypothetical protein